MAVWSAKGGYNDGKKLTDLQELRAQLATYDADFNAALDGTAVITDPGRGPVRAYYTTLQALLGRTDLPDDERASLEAKRDQTLRLLYFSKAVAPTFADHYKAELKAGYEAVGKQVPDFANLSRAAALIQINLFRWSLPKPSPEAANRCLELLTEGLQNLSPGIIPTEWL